MSVFLRELSNDEEKLKEHFDKKCMNCDPFEQFKDIDQAYDYAVDYVGLFGAFKWGFEIAHSLIKEEENNMLEKAYKFIKEAKRLHYPNTTNSLVDEWIKDYEDKKDAIKK